MKEKKTHIRTPKPPFIDFSPFKSSTVRMFVTCSSIASLGAYTPIFLLSLQGSREGYDVQDLVLLQTFLGLAIAFGVVISGSIINRDFSISYRKFNISRQCVCQVGSFQIFHTCTCRYRNIPSTIHKNTLYWIISFMLFNLHQILSGPFGAIILIPCCLMFHITCR